MHKRKEFGIPFLNVFHPPSLTVASTFSSFEDCMIFFHYTTEFETEEEIRKAMVDNVC